MHQPAESPGADGARLLRESHSPLGVLLGVGVASVVATVPLALSTAHGSATRPLVGARARAAVRGRDAHLEPRRHRIR